MPTLLARLGRAAARGFGAGIVATSTMSAAMLGFQKAGLMGRMPPRKITEHLLAALGLRSATSRRERRVLSTLLHFGFGGVAGASFEVAREALAIRRGEPTPRRAPLGLGLAYGTAVWTVSYLGWVPALGIMPPAPLDRPGRPTAMVVAHWVFGGTLAALVR